MSNALRTIELAVREINAGDHDSFGTLAAVGNDDAWVQYMPGTINARYPFDIPPAENLVTFQFTSVEEFVPGEYVWLDISLPEPELTVWIDRYFKEILRCDDTYQLNWKREQY